MANCFTCLLLAVVASVIVAHGKILPLSEKANVTSRQIATAAAAAASGQNLLNLDKTKDEHRTSSAVQDWSLVCQQLCGAALGGAACLPHCGNVAESSAKVQTANADTLMASKYQFICPQLCRLQLGDAVCTCDSWIIDDSLESLEKSKVETTNVCAIFCDHTHVTLAGCSPCGQITTKTTAAVSKTPKNMSPTAENLYKAMVLDKVDATAATGTSRPTTPNWKELCAALCKTGDGGSLCNCDLSPFMV